MNRPPNAPTPDFDCIVAGSCVVDLLCRPIPLDKPIGGGLLHPAQPTVLTAGGITANAGITMARLGLTVGLLSYVGDDPWGPILRQLLRENHVNDQLLSIHPTEPTSTTVVAIDPSGERSFFHCVGAPQQLNAKAILNNLDTLARTRFFLLGYYSLMPNLEADLPQVLKEIRRVGCKTALDAAGSGGDMHPLDQILPHLDVYVPSLAEASHQTGLDDPRKIIDQYRQCGAPGLLGVKLGRQGVMLSPQHDQYLHVPIVDAPGPRVDTTGAGDSFYAGLLTGLIKGLDLHDAAKLGTAAGACCVTAVGGWAGARSYQQTAQIAGLNA